MASAPRWRAPSAQYPQTIRDWERRALEDFAMPTILLMENAGGGAARVMAAIAASEPDSLPEPWIFLCGSGNNGGDGFVAARHAHNAGFEVEVHLAFDPAVLEDGRDNTVSFRILERMDLPIHCGRPSFPPPPALSADGAFTIVDALFGTGLSRPLAAPVLDWVEQANRSGRPIVALDVPTGLDCRTGEVLGAAISARHTITFAAAKVGFESGEGPRLCGEVHVVDIGMPREIWIAPVVEPH